MRVAFLAPGALTGPVVSIRKCAGGWQDLFPDEIGIESETAGIGDVWDGEVLTPVPRPAPSAGELTAYASDLRWRVETGGIVVAGATIRTDERSQQKIAAAVQLIDKDPTLAPINFEAQPGVWITLDAAAMTAIGLAVGRHIQACFSTLKNVHGAIAAGTITDFTQIDAAGWPPND